MHLRVDRTQLLRVVAHAQGVVEKKTTVPLLAHMRLRTEAEALSLAATDLDLAYTERVAASIDEPGMLSVPAHLFYDILRKLPTKAELTLTTQGLTGQMKVIAGQSEFVVPTLPGDEFPDIQHAEMPCRFEMAAADLRFLIDHTRFAIALEETRYYLNGLYWHVDAHDTEHLRVVATDGHRLAKAKIPRPQGCEAMPSVILSRKTIGELRKIIDTADGAVVVALSDRQVQFQVGSAVLVSRLIDGVFPDYQRVIPSQHNRTATIAAAALAEAVDRVAIITHERARAVRFSFAANQCELTTHNAENGSAREVVAIDYVGEPLAIGFNARYIADILDQVAGDTVTIALSDTTAPALVRDQGDGRVLYVVMPMRV